MTSHIITTLLIFSLIFIHSVKCSINVQLDSGLESGLFLEVADEEHEDPLHESTEVTRFFTLLQPKTEISVRASFGPISVQETIYPQKESFKIPSEFESNGKTDGINNPVKLYHNEDYSDLDFDLKEVLHNKSKDNGLKPVILTLPGQGFDVSGHLVKKEITRNNPVVQVLFYAGHSNDLHQHLPSTYSNPSRFQVPQDLIDKSIDFDYEPNEPESIDTGSNNLLCAVVIVSKEEEKLFGVCSPSLSREGSCLASVTLPSSWWPSVTYNYTNRKQYKPVAASVDYILVKDSSCSESSLGMNPSTPDHLIRSIESLSDPFPLGSVNQLQEVKLILFKGTYEEVTNDNMIKILIPQETTHPNARLYIPVTFKPNPNYPVTAFSIRVKVKSGLKVLGAQIAPHSSWQISLESSPKGNVATVTCFLRDQDLQMNDAATSGFRKNSNRGQGSKHSKPISSSISAQEVFSFLLEVDDRADVTDNGRIVWQLLYITESHIPASALVMKGHRKEQTYISNSKDSVNTLRKDFLDRESLKLTSKVDVGKDEVSSIIGVSKSNQMLNTATLTGKQVSQPLKIFVVSKSGRSGDVTLQSTCHSLDESSLKVSQSCTSVYLDGSEIRPSVNSTIIIKYGSYVGYSSFVVWMPKIPIEIRVKDSKLSQIKGWRIPHTKDEDTVKTIRKNKKRKRSSSLDNRDRKMNRGKRGNSNLRINNEGKRRKEVYVRTSADDDYGHVHSNDFNDLDSVYNLNRFTESNNFPSGVSEDVRKRKGFIEESKKLGRKESSTHQQNGISSILRNALYSNKESNFEYSGPSAAKRKNGSYKLATNGKGTSLIGDAVTASGTVITSPGSEDNNNNHHSNSNMGSDTNNCRLRYQQTKVKVLTKFYTNDHESGRETYLSSRGNYFDVTFLVSSNVRILDPRILSFRSSNLVIEGLSPGNTQVQVISPITGRILGATDIKVATDRETITNLNIHLVTGLNLQVFPYSDFSDNIWAARVMTTDQFSSLYQEGLFDIKLLMSDGTVTSLESVSPQDYHISIDIFHENRAIAIAPPSPFTVSSNYPRLIAINEGKDQLIHISLEVPNICQRKRTQQLAMSYMTINVDFNGGDEGSSLINLQQNDVFSKLRSKLNRSRNSRPSLFSPGYSYSSSSGYSRTSNTGNGISSSDKDFNYHRERILKMILAKSESDNSIRVVDTDRFDPGLYYHNLTPLEIGMYSLLIIFSLAVLIFIFSCLVFAIKFRSKSDHLSLPYYSTPPQDQNHFAKIVTNVAHLPSDDQTHRQIPKTSPVGKVRGREKHEANLDLSSVLRKPLIENRSLGRDTQDNDWIFMSHTNLGQAENNLPTSRGITDPSTNSNPLIDEKNTKKGNKDRSLDRTSFVEGETFRLRGSFVSDPDIPKPSIKCRIQHFYSDDTFDIGHRDRDGSNESKNGRSSSGLYPESEESCVRITTNPFRAENDEEKKCVAQLEINSDILSDTSSEPKDHFSFSSSSDEEYRDRDMCSSEDGSLKLDAISRLRKKAQLRKGKNSMHTFKASTNFIKNQYPLLLNESLQRSAVEEKPRTSPPPSAPPPIPARRSTITRNVVQVESEIQAKEKDQNLTQSSCGSDVEYLYGVVMKSKKKGTQNITAQSSIESEEPSSSSEFGPPTSDLVSDDSCKKDENVKEKVSEDAEDDRKVRHPQATCSTAPDVPEHGPKSESNKSSDIVEKIESEKPPPVPLHVPRRPSHRVNYSRTAGKLSTRPPPIPAHSDTMKLSISPCNKPLPPSPSKKNKERSQQMSPSFNRRTRSHSRPKSLSLKSTFQGGLSLVPHPHLPTRRVDSRNIDKEWEQATKGMNYNQLMEYFNNLKESSA